MMVKKMKKIAMILFISIFLLLSLSADTAEKTNNTITNINDSNSLQTMNENVTIINGTYYILDKDNGIAKTDGKICVDKSVKPTITMTGKPSCTICVRNHCAYTWRTKTYLNYCPNCHHWNCLGNKHKRGAVHEKEITCFRCDSDFCVNCGKEKYSWSHKYLIKP